MTESGRKHEKNNEFCRSLEKNKIRRLVL